MQIIVLVIGSIWYFKQVSLGKGQYLVDFFKKYLVLIIFLILGILVIGYVLVRGYNLFSFKYIWYTLLSLVLAGGCIYWLNLVFSKAKERGFDLPIIFGWLSLVLVVSIFISISAVIYQETQNRLNDIERKYVFNPPNVILDSLEVLKGDTFSVSETYGLNYYSLFSVKVSSKKIQISYWAGDDLEARRARAKIKNELSRKNKLLYDQEILFNIPKTWPQSNYFFDGVFRPLGPSDTTCIVSQEGSKYRFNEKMLLFYMLIADKETGFVVKINKQKSPDIIKDLIKSEIMKRFPSFYLLLFMFLSCITNIKRWD